MRRLLSLALAAACTPVALAQTLPTTALGAFSDVRTTGVGLNPAFVVFKGEVYFAAAGIDGAGTELWRTDGTAAGTVRVADLNAGAGSSSPAGFAVFGGRLYFNASNGTTTSVYRTDGVNGVELFAPYGVRGLTATSIGLFGTATNVVAGAGTEPWFSNGTTHGMLKNIAPVNAAHGTPNRLSTGSFAFTDRGGTVFFAADDHTSPGGQLWKTLGTEASTERVLQLNVAVGFAPGCSNNAVSDPAEGFVYGGTFHFVATWYEKGTPPPGQSRDACFVTGLDWGYLGALWTSTGSVGNALATRALAATLGTSANRVWVDRATEGFGAAGPLGSRYLVQGRAELVSGPITYAGPPRLYAFNGSDLTPLTTAEETGTNSPLDAFVRMGDANGRRIVVRNRQKPGSSFGERVSDVIVTDGTPGGTSVVGSFDARVDQGYVSDGYAYFVPQVLDGAQRQVYRTDGVAAPVAVTALSRAVSFYFNVQAALPGGVLAVDANYNIANGTTLYAVGTPGTRVVRQPLSAPGPAAQTLSDGTASLGVAFDVQAIAGSGEMRLHLLDHAAEPLPDGAPTAGVLRRYVRIERPASITSIETALTLTYDAADLAAAGADEGSLAVWKYSDGAWTRLDVAARDLNANTLRVDGITSFSDFVIADGSASLPVELAAFTATASGSTARLAWTTASETNNAGFYVERQNGAAWTDVSPLLAGQGTTTERHHYAFDVPSLTAGRHTFRLRQVDTDGAVRYSASVTVEIGVGTSAGEHVRWGMRLTALGGRGLRVETDSAATVTVVDVLGRTVRTEAVASGTTHLRFDDVSAGVYFVRADANGRAVTTRLVVR